jgi:hypothetical protein
VFVAKLRKRYKGPQGVSKLKAFYNEAAQGSVQKAWSLTIGVVAEVMSICEESKSVRKALVGG